MKKTAAALMLSALAATSANAAEMTPSSRIVAKVYAQNLRKLLDGALRDLPNTRFRDVYAVVSHAGSYKTPIFAICGAIDAKNGMGGYSGWRAFGLAQNFDGSFVTGWSLFLADEPTGEAKVEQACMPAGADVEVDNNPDYTKILSGQMKVVNDD